MDSILDTIKKVLGLAEDYTAFDVDVIVHINAMFSILNELGVGPEGGFFIADNAATWAQFEVPENQLHLVKTWMYLKTKLAFDPPATSFAIATMEKQIAEFEYRLNTMREVLIPEEIIP